MPLDPSERSDWSELDLLTVSEATERLDDETALVRQQVEELEAAEPADVEALAAAQRRLSLLDRARERSMKATVAIAPGRVRTIEEIAETPGPPD
jgi:hypothetical protein